MTSQLSRARRFEHLVSEKQEQTGLLLENVLSEPILRIPRYRILLEQIIKYTDTDDTIVLQDLNEGLAMIRDVAEQCNETVRIKQKRDKLMALINRMDFRNRINLLEPKQIKDDDLDDDDAEDGEGDVESRESRSKIESPNATSASASEPNYSSNNITKSDKNNDINNKNNTDNMDYSGNSNPNKDYNITHTITPTNSGSKTRVKHEC